MMLLHHVQSRLVLLKALEIEIKVQQDKQQKKQQRRKEGIIRESFKMKFCEEIEAQV